LRRRPKHIAHNRKSLVQMVNETVITVGINLRSPGPPENKNYASAFR